MEIAEWNKKVDLFNQCVRESFRQSGYDNILDVCFFSVTGNGFKSELVFNPCEECSKPWILRSADGESEAQAKDVTDLLFNRELIREEDYPEDTWESAGNFIDLNIWCDHEEPDRSVSLHPIAINIYCGQIETDTGVGIAFQQSKKPTQ